MSKSALLALAALLFPMQAAFATRGVVFHHPATGQPQTPLIRHTHDAAGNLTQAHANLDTWSWTYNALQKTGQLDAKLVTTTYTYDARDRLRTLTAPGIERLHTYDLAGRLLTVSETGRPEASIANTWDAHGRLMSETSRGLTHSHSYDLAGNRVATTYSTGRSVTTTHDAHNRPATITEGGRTTLYGYDKAGRAVLMTAGNGQTTNNTYDALGRLTDRTLFQTPAMLEADVLVQLGWDHDAAGNVLAQHETWPGSPARPADIRSTLMGYDDNYRLTSETLQTRADAQSQPVTQSTTAYTYNDANNRVTKTVTGGPSLGHWTYHSNEANQLETWTQHDAPAGTLIRSAALTYDANGNRETLAITEGATTSTTTYSWDALDRLTAVEMPDGTTHTYSYDHRTRRHGITRSGGSLPPHQTLLTFTGGLSAAEWEAENATPDLNTTPTVEYQRGPDMGGGVGGLLYSLRGGNAKFNLSNGRGDIIAQSDAAATITWTASYEAGGKRPVETGTNPDKQRGNSKDEDPTGLLNENLRYRELEHMVWLSRDPAGFVDGLNLYAYVRQNPWSKFDPLGLSEESTNAGNVIAKAAQDRAALIKELTGDDSAEIRVREGNEMAGITANVADTIASFTPGGAINEAIGGKNAQGEELSGCQKVMAWIGLIPGGKVLDKATDAVSATSKLTSKQADAIVEQTLKKGGETTPKNVPVINSSLIAGIKGKLNLYPQVIDPRTGRNIQFPSGIQGRVPKADRVQWGG